MYLLQQTHVVGISLSIEFMIGYFTKSFMSEHIPMAYLYLTPCPHKKTKRKERPDKTQYNVTRHLYSSPKPSPVDIPLNNEWIDPVISNDVS